MADADNLVLNVAIEGQDDVISSLGEVGKAAEDAGKRVADSFDEATKAAKDFSEATEKAATATKAGALAEAPAGPTGEELATITTRPFSKTAQRFGMGAYAPKPEDQLPPLPEEDIKSYEAGSLRIREALHLLHPVLRELGVSLIEVRSFLYLATEGFTAFGAVVAGTALIEGIRRFGDYAQAIRQAQTALQGFTGSAAQAEKIWGELNQQAVKLHVETKDLAPAYENLTEGIQKFNIQQEQAGRVTVRLSDEDAIAGITTLNEALQNAGNSAEESRKAVEGLFDSINKNKGVLSAASFAQFTAFARDAANVMARNLGYSDAAHMQVALERGTQYTARDILPGPAEQRRTQQTFQETQLGTLTNTFGELRRLLIGEPGFVSQEERQAARKVDIETVIAAMTGGAGLAVPRAPGPPTAPPVPPAGVVPTSIEQAKQLEAAQDKYAETVVEGAKGVKDAQTDFVDAIKKAAGEIDLTPFNDALREAGDQLRLSQARIQAQFAPIEAQQRRAREQLGEESALVRAGKAAGLPGTTPLSLVEPLARQRLQMMGPAVTLEQEEQQLGLRKALEELEEARTRKQKGEAEQPTRAELEMIGLENAQLRVLQDMLLAMKQGRRPGGGELDLGSLSKQLDQAIGSLSSSLKQAGPNLSGSLQSSLDNVSSAIQRKAVEIGAIRIPQQGGDGRGGQDMPQFSLQDIQRAVQGIAEQEAQVETTLGRLVSAISEAASNIADAMAQMSKRGGGMQRGGLVTGIMQYGGLVTGGTRGRDSVHIMAEPDEFMMRSAATRFYGVNVMHSINEMKVPKGRLGYLHGGLIDFDTPGLPHFSLGGVVNLEPHLRRQLLHLSLGGVVDLEPRLRQRDFSLGGLVDGIDWPLRSYQVGGAVTAQHSSLPAMGRPLTLYIGGEVIGGLTATDRAAADISRVATQRAIRSGGTKPSWYTGT